MDDGGDSVQLPEITTGVRHAGFLRRSLSRRSLGKRASGLTLRRRMGSLTSPGFVWKGKLKGILSDWV
jgi:hypothetical protein